MWEVATQAKNIRDHQTCRVSISHLMVSSFKPNNSYITTRLRLPCCPIKRLSTNAESKNCYRWTAITVADHQLAAPSFHRGLYGFWRVQCREHAVVDVYPQSVSEVLAANNLWRCFSGADASVVVGDRLQAIERAGTFIFFKVCGWHSVLCSW